MHTDEARAAIAEVSPLQPDRIVRIEGGWASHTFLVHDEWIFRFPRTDEVARGLEREIRLLPPLARAVSFRVPHFEYIGTFAGRPFVGYQMIPGVPLEEVDFDDRPILDIARVLRELHGFADARTILGDEGTVDEWRSDYEALRRKTIVEVHPLVDDEMRTAIDDGFKRFMEALAFEPVLVHRDLGTEHVLVSNDRSVAGVIDFEDAAIGDPVIDFVGFRNAFGAEVTQRIAHEYGKPLDEAEVVRLHFYVWMGSVHAIFYGLQIGDAALVEEAIGRLRRRLGRL